MPSTSIANSNKETHQVRKLRSNSVGVAQGQTLLFSDFKDNGEMWAGLGDRSLTKDVQFDEPFHTPPVVHLSISLLDLDHSVNPRMDLRAESVTSDGFQVLFSTWGDSRVARIRVSWMAIGEVGPIDMWDID